MADADKNRRIVVARVLSNAGYDVKFALTPEDALSYSVGASLVVFNVALSPDVKALVERSQGGECRWLFTAPSAGPLPAGARKRRAAMSQSSYN